MKKFLFLLGTLSLAACSVAPDDQSAEASDDAVGQTLQFATTADRKAAIDAKRAANTWLGAATTGYLNIASRPGMARDYANGTIAFGDAVNRAHYVIGSIRQKWWDYSGADGFLAFPTSDELDPAYQDGKFSTFEGGVVYWKSATGAHEVHGCHYDVWGRLGWEFGALGYPTTDEITVGDKKVSRFETGNLYFRTGSTGSNCGSLSWPVLTNSNSNTYNRARVQGKGYITATLTSNQLGAQLTVKGENFKPGEELTFTVNTPSHMTGVSMPNWTAGSDGKFNISQVGMSGAGWYISAGDLKSVNGYVTIAVRGSKNTLAVARASSVNATPYTGAM